MFCLYVNCAEDGSECFTLEVIHGGFFVGCGSNRAYVNGSKVCFDECDMDTWSAFWLEDIISHNNCACSFFRGVLFFAALYFALRFFAPIYIVIDYLPHFSLAF